MPFYRDKDLQKEKMDTITYKTIDLMIVKAFQESVSELISTPKNLLLNPQTQKFFNIIKQSHQTPFAGGALMPLYQS